MAVLGWMVRPVTGLSFNGKLYEPDGEKTCLQSFRPAPTQTGLYSHRRWLES